ncbi:MAG: TIGR04053 family radical SAM/SPASM domain-containing protein [Kiritimatiellae bacterium]|jgi:radical SAM protein|nr:TIGR04053 family radical SAM/SPASM domain-containing protein [Kiritimatiellia bacterium]
MKKAFDVDFHHAPLLVIWEITRACALACQHCRASAIDRRDPGELSLEEGTKLLDDIREMGTPIVVFTGGDPLQRDDLEDLIHYGKSIGLRIGTIPAGTPRLTYARMQSIKDSGVDQVAFSIDASHAEAHDAFRQVPGSYERTLQGARWAGELDIPLQINTVFHQGNLHEVEALAEQVAELGTVFWEVFFLVPTGRGSQLKGCTAEEMEDIFSQLHTLSKTAPFVIKVTEAQHYRRHVMQQEQHARRSLANREPAEEVHASSRHPHAIGRSSKVVNAGNGFCFIDHTGNICPSGFLSEIRGNTRTHSLQEVYRHDELFVNLRNPRLLKGKCGRCEYKATCGGSRSRAWAVHGDAFAEEPFCVLER